MNASRSSFVRATLLVAASCAILPGAGPAAAQQPGEVDSELKLSQVSGSFAGDLDEDDRFGGAVALVGDLDGDGLGDLLVGAPRDDDGASQAGALWVLFLDAQGAVRETRKISATQGGLDAPLHQNDHFGSAVAALGDVDGDGVPDAAVGIPGSDVGAPQAGQVRILFLRPDGSVKSSGAIGAGAGGFPGTLASNDDFGIAVAGLGDLDGDGVPDLAVGADGDDGGKPQAGAIWILFLEHDGRVRQGQKIGAGQGGFSGWLDSNDYFGSALARVGDLDADGLAELAVGAPGDDEGGSAAGAVWILHLHADGRTQGQDLIASASGGLPTPLEAGDLFGRALAATGDLDGDGRDDLAVGLPGADQGGPDRGALRLLLLASDASVASEIKISGLQGGFGGTLDDGDEFGISVTAAPIDPATGHARLFVGAWRDDDGGVNFGAAWVLELQGTGGSQPFEPSLESIVGSAGQPAILIPPAAPGDDFIGEPVVVVPNSGNAISVEHILSEIGGDVSFAENSTYETGASPLAARAADFTSDAQADIVTANSGADSISLLVQVSGAADGGGGFSPKIDTQLPFDDNPVALRTGDLDGDGDQDLVVAGDAGLTTFVGDGQGLLVAAGFAPVAFLADLELGDGDGDGDLDVVSASGAPAAGPGAETGFATSLANDGTGDLAALATFATGKAVASVLLADFDAGGAPDALLAVHELDGGPAGLPQGRIDLWIGDGAGGYSPSPAFAGLALPDADGIHPRWGGLADVNGDGRPDAAYTGNDSLAFPAGSLAQEQPPLTLTLLLGTAGGGFTTSIIPTAYAGKGVAPLLADIAPVPGDGFADCILVWTQDALAGEVGAPAGATQPITFLAALVGDGLGGFSDASPNQFLGAEEPGDAAVAEVGDAPGDGAGGGPDLLIPDLAARSLNVWLGDGEGDVTGPVVVPDVDPIDADALPPGGIWQGGPRSVSVLDLDGDVHPDVAVYSRWDDLAGLFASRAGFVTRQGDGTGDFAGGADVLLQRAGELAVGDIGGDGAGDIVVTLRTDGSGDSVAVYAAGAGGQLVLPPQQAPAPAGYELTGGLELADVNGLPGDEILTSGSSGAGGALVVVSEAGGVLSARAFPLGVDWDQVRSLDAGLIDQDGLLDVALGLADGRLVLARGNGKGVFAPLVTGATAAAVGGGALRLTEIDGDGRADILSSSASLGGTLDQAFVRELFGAGNGAFEVVTLPGVSSVGSSGALRPAVGDLDGDGATDVVLTHGGSGNVSLLLNQLSTFVAFGNGKPGSGDLVPELSGTGYTTLGGSIGVSLEGGLGGAPALLWIGSGPLPDHPYFAMENVAAELSVLLSGMAGEPGAGSWSISTHLPNIDRFAGLELVLQLVVADPGADGPGPANLAFSNGLSFTILP